MNQITKNLKITALCWMVFLLPFSYLYGVNQGTKYQTDATRRCSNLFSLIDKYPLTEMRFGKASFITDSGAFSRDCPDGYFDGAGCAPLLFRKE